MTDNQNLENGNGNENYQRVYTEEEVMRLFQEFRASERLADKESKEERELPLDISSALEETSQQQLQDNFKKYKRDISKYHHEDWTVAEEINKSFIPKLKSYTVGTLQVVTACYKGSDIIRTNGRAATKIYEQLLAIKNQELSAQEREQLLDEATESARRLAIFAWAQAKQNDEDAKGFTLKALRLPPISSIWRRRNMETNEKHLVLSSLKQTTNTKLLEQ